jgi:hypothetical protein
MQLSSTSAIMFFEEYHANAQRFTISVIVAGLLRVVQQQSAALGAQDEPILSPSSGASAEADAMHTLAATQHEASDTISSKVCAILCVLLLLLYRVLQNKHLLDMLTACGISIYH